MPTAPCKKCPNRKLYCHTVCEDYKTFKQRIEFENAIIRKAKAISEYKILTCRISRGDKQI